MSADIEEILAAGRWLLATGYWQHPAAIIAHRRLIKAFPASS